MLFGTDGVFIHLEKIDFNTGKKEMKAFICQTKTIPENNFASLVQVCPFLIKQFWFEIPENWK